MDRVWARKDRQPLRISRTSGEAQQGLNSAFLPDADLLFLERCITYHVEFIVYDLIASQRGGPAATAAAGEMQAPVSPMLLDTSS